ncbi:hypothetical protein JCM5353_001403 [Sporobolomyces roseus]
MTIAQELNFGYSPGSSADFEDGLNPLAFDDDFNNDLGLDEDEDDGRYDQQSANGTQLTKPKRNNNRKGPGNADKRATHNAVERARRESLNGRFTVLAESLPTMKNIKRPSKAMIVNKALDFVYDAQVRERTLVQENNELRREVDQLRARLGMPPLPPPAPLPQSKPATQPTMRKTRKAQSVSAASSSAPTSTAPTSNIATSESPAGLVGAVASPALDGAYPSPSVSAYSSNGSAQPALYESPTLTAEFASSLFPSHEHPATNPLDTASSPADTMASAASPTLINPFLPQFDPASIPSHSASAPPAGPQYMQMFNPAMVQAHLAAAQQAGMMPPQALYNPQAASYLNNPALLYAMQQQYLSQQQQAHQPAQVQQHSSPATSCSPQSYGSFSQDSSSLWAGTPPSWGPFSQQTPTTVDGLSF